MTQAPAVSEESGNSFNKRDEFKQPSTEDLIEESELGGDYLEQLLDILDIDGDLDLDVVNNQAKVSLSNCPDSNILIGRHGKTLNSLQHLARLAVQKHITHRSRLLLDIAGWRDSQKARLEEYAERQAAIALESRQSVELHPMSPFERKIIHDFLSSHEGVSTRSVGQEKNRHIIIELDN